MTTDSLLQITELAPGTNVVLPRLGQTAAEDAFAHATNLARSNAINRFFALFPAIEIDRTSYTTDDNRLMIAGAVDDAAGSAGREQDTPPNRAAPAVGFAGMASAVSGGAPTGDPELPGADEPQVSFAERFSLDTMVRDLTRIYGSPVHPAVVEADLELRWMPHDILAIQIDGASVWRVTEPSGLSPLPGYSDPEPTQNEVWSGELPAGTAAYVPRGWGHEVTMGGICMLLTIQRWTGLDIVRELAQPAGHHPLLRADAPVDVAAASISYDGDLYRELLFSEALAALTTLEQVDSCLARLQCQVAFPAEPVTETIGAEDVFRLNAPTGVFWVADQDPDADEVTVAVAAREVTFSVASLPVMSSIANGEPTRIVDLPLTGAADGSARVVQELAAAGLIQLL